MQTDVQTKIHHLLTDPDFLHLARSRSRPNLFKTLAAFHMNQEMKTPLDDDLRNEYDEIILKNGERGKYVQRLTARSNIVRLAPDVAAAFPTEEAVNQALRLLLNVAKTRVR